MIKVHLARKAVGESVWKHTEIPPSEYFWVDPDDSTRAWEVDSTPKHDLISQLLDSVGSEILERAITKVVDDESGNYCECSYHFWRDHENHACLSTLKMGTRVERELIFSGPFPFKENGSHVVRVTLGDTTPNVTMNTFTWGAGDEHSIDMLRADEANKAFKADVGSSPKIIDTPS